jgi:hypothetical protein
MTIGLISLGFVKSQVLKVNNSLAKSNRDSMRLITCAEPSNGCLDVLVDGPLGNPENLRDFPHRLALRGPLQDLQRPGRQCVLASASVVSNICQMPFRIAAVK